MKMKFTLIAAIALLGFSAKAQTFSDDFESYTVGSKLGPQSTNWTTWSNADGGTEDVAVIASDSYSGTKSIYFSSTSATGGPADVVLPFGGVYTSGTFEFKARFKVPSTKTGYFNFQANATIGQIWALDCYMNADQTLTMGNTGGQLFSGTYPQGNWFELKYIINLNTNQWKVFVNDTLRGTFSNTVNQIASLDIYPANAAASYWVDDVSYTYTPYVLPTFNAALTSLEIANGLTGQTKTVSAQIRNLGNTAITSFDINLNYNGNSQTKNVTGVNIASLAVYDVTLDQNITLANGSNNAVATISNVNGNATDGDSTDNVKSIAIAPVNPAAGKIVVAEEGTGTWCQWCPRGAVFMDLMETNYEGYVAPIAVHNADPMTYTIYDAGMGAYLAGYPQVIMDRGTAFDPSQLEANFLNKVTAAPIAILENGATYNATTRELKVSVTSTFNSAIAGDYKMACVLTEDSVKGTGSTWSQANAYAGGANGVMGGYELLANPVPFTKMQYDHVARIICPSFEGYANAFGASVASGASVTHTYTYVLPTNWRTNKMHIINMLINPSGTIENASNSTIAEAIAKGYTSGMEIGTNVTGIQTLAGPDAIQIYPNPAGNTATISFDLKSNSAVTLAVYALDGKLIANRVYENLSGANAIPMDISGFANGVYFVRLTTKDASSTLRLIKE
jgi:hypothetical protein